MMYALQSNHSSADGITDFEQSLAGFLLLRGPYAWLGWAWSSCVDPPPRPAALDKDYGEPLGICEERGGEPGVFTREYTKASVSLDCNKWVGAINAKGG